MRWRRTTGVRRAQVAAAGEAVLLAGWEKTFHFMVESPDIAINIPAAEGVNARADVAETNGAFQEVGNGPFAFEA